MYPVDDLVYDSLAFQLAVHKVTEIEGGIPCVQVQIWLLSCNGNRSNEWYPQALMEGAKPSRPACVAASQEHLVGHRLLD